MRVAGQGTRFRLHGVARDPRARGASIEFALPPCDGGCLRASLAGLDALASYDPTS